MAQGKTAGKSASDLVSKVASAPPPLLPAEVRATILARWDQATDDDARETIMADAAKNLAVAPSNAQALFTAAVGHELIEDFENAGKGYLRLAKVLAVAQNWADAREIALRALPFCDDWRLVRVLLEADEHLGDDEQKAEDIAFAHDHCSDSPDLLWIASQAADQNGQEKEAAKLADEALRRFVDIKDGAGAEEPLLRVLESGARDHLTAMIALLPRIVADGLTALLDTTMEFGLPEIRKRGLLPQLADAFENILIHGKPPDGLRETFVDLLSETLGGKEPLRDIIADSKISEEKVPLEKALARFRELCVYRPGAFVEHNTWGIGEIESNDGAALVINFADKSSHRMDLQIARRALRALAPDLLRVLSFRDPELLAREAAEDPVAIVLRAIKEFSGDLTAKELKPLVAGTVFPEPQWANWWKNARGRLATDPRIDSSKVHQGIYALAPEGQEASVVQLPPLDPKKGVKGAVSAIARMLKQNPNIADQVREHYGSLVEQWTRGTHESDDRLRGALYLNRWYPERREHWLAIVDDGFASRRAGVMCLASPEDQAELLDLGLATGHWREASLSAVASRFIAVRQRGLDELAARLGEGLREAFDESLAAAVRYPSEALAIAGLDLAGLLPLPEGEHLNPWDALHATLLVLISVDTKTLFNEALEVLDPQEELAQRLVDNDCDEERLGEFAATSERYELPGSAREAAIRLLTDTGHKEMIGPVLGDRYVDKGEDLIGLHFSPRVTLMTRATFERSTADVEFMRHELATTIPREIAAARALGDLRENAEYHAARERQGIMTAMEKTLNGELQQARIIDDMQIPDGVIGVATEFVLRDVQTEETQTLWMLGHRDNEMYDAINYRATLGQLLCGKKVGDVVEVEFDGAMRMFEVASIKHRSPIGEPVKIDPSQNRTIGE